LRSSGFVGTLGNKSDTQSSQSENFFGTLDVDEMPSATNSAEFLVTGTVTNFDKVEFFVNDKKVQSGLVDSKDAFSKIVGSLEKGKNEVYVKALTSDSKHTKVSETFTIYYKNEKPLLEITEPGDNSRTNRPEIKIAGKTDKGVAVHINQSPVVVNSEGVFQQTVRLNEGENKITIDVEDDAGNTDQKILTVTYQKD
jgi:hypothetical protein